MILDSIEMEIIWDSSIEEGIASLNELRKDGTSKKKEIENKIKRIKSKKGYTPSEKNEKIAELNVLKDEASKVEKANELQVKLISKRTMEVVDSNYSKYAPMVDKAVNEKIAFYKNEFKRKSGEAYQEYQTSLGSLKNEQLDQKLYNERKKGIDTKYKRAKKALAKEKINSIIDAKKARYDLRNARDSYEETINGKLSMMSNFKNQQIEKHTSFSLEKVVTDRTFWLSKISIFCFLALVLVYLIVCTIGGIKIEYEKIISGSSIIIAVALGGVFIYSQKGFDMSLGGGTALAAAMGGLVWNSTKSIVAVLAVTIAVGLVIELINSSLADVLKLPVMVTTLAMSSVLGAILTKMLEDTNITTTQTIKITGIKELDTFAFYIIVLVVFFLICAFIFKATPMGRRNKMIGANKVSSKYTGVNIRTQGILTFAIAGVAIGVGALLYIVRSKTVSMNSCSTIGLDVILAVVFGGMQVTGGPKSKISAAIVGGLTTTLISYLLIAIGRATGFDALTNYESFVKGVLFIGIVAINQIGSNNKRLPGIIMMW